jgi:hypothetical protein
MQAVRALGAAVPAPALLAVAALCSALAAILAGSWLAAIWRGPTLVSFSMRHAVLCDVAEAGAVRSAAQLRGTMGGAGYLHRFRAVFPAAMWTAVTVQSAALVAGRAETPVVWPLAAVLVAGGLTLALPARAFWYREVSGGCVLVYPAAVCVRVLQAAGVAPALTRFDPDAPAAHSFARSAAPVVPSELRAAFPPDEDRPDA